MSTHNDIPFLGFEYPQENYFRLPNDWFDTWAWVRAHLKARGRKTCRLDGLLKWMEYLIKHSWGYLNFHFPIRLTTDEFKNGRRHATRDGTRGDRMDLGTGLSSRTLVGVPQLLLNLGLIEREVDDSDKARIKHWYVPRLHPPANEESSVTSCETLDTFGGFAYPDSNYFPVPFVWTDLTREIHSAVQILTVEYLMRHTFGWRDPVRWLTPVEIANGHRKSDGTTYDYGIQYPRDTVASACESMAKHGLLVWRPAERDIGREEREYALRMRDMLVDQDSGRWLGMETGETEESKTLTGQSKATLTPNDIMLTTQSKGPDGESKTLGGQSKTLTGESTTRSENNTYIQNLLRHLDTTPTTTPPMGSVDAVALQQALIEVGIMGGKKSELLALDDPPQPEDVYGWAYWAHAQDWADRNPIGAAIGQLLDPATRHNPPYPFNFFGLEHGEPVSAARALAEAYRLVGYTPPSQSRFFDDLMEQWHQYLGGCFPNELPLPNPAATMWPLELEVLRAGLDHPPTSEIARRWRWAWQEFLTQLLPSSCRLWHDVSRPLGHSKGRLVILVTDLVARATVEQYRSDLEARMGERIQFTAIELRLPVPGAEEPGVSEADRVWEHILREVRLGVTRAMFEHNFAHCIPLTFQDHCLTVQTPDKATWQWITKRLRQVLARAAAHACEDVFQLRLVTGGNEEARIDISAHLKSVDNRMKQLKEGCL